MTYGENGGPQEIDRVKKGTIVAPQYPGFVYGRQRVERRSHTLISMQ